MTNFEYYKTLIIGVIIGASTVILGFYMVKPQAQQPVAPKSNFEVVDTYMGCDIIKRENKSVFESQYFMDCRK